MRRNGVEYLSQKKKKNNEQPNTTQKIKFFLTETINMIYMINTTHSTIFNIPSLLKFTYMTVGLYTIYSNLLLDATMHKQLSYCICISKKYKLTCITNLHC